MLQDCGAVAERTVTATRSRTGRLSPLPGRALTVVARPTSGGTAVFRNRPCAGRRRLLRVFSLGEEGRQLVLVPQRLREGWLVSGCR